MPTRGASTSISSSCARTSASASGVAIGHRRHPSTARARCRGAAACRRRRSSPRQHTPTSRAASGSAPSAGHVQHAPAGGDDRPVAARAVPAWVTSTSSGTRSSPLITIAARGRGGVAGARQHDGDRPAGATTVELGDRAPASRPAHAREQQLEQVRAQPRQQRLRLGVAEAHVELDHPRAVGGQHQAGVEDAVKRRPARAHPVDDRLVDAPRQLAPAARRPSRRPASRSPCRRCSDRGRRRRCACSPAPAPSGSRARRRRARAATAPRRSGAPRRRRSRPCRSGARRRCPAARACACSASSATITPLPAASPSALSTRRGRPARRPRRCPPAASATWRQRAVGTPASSIACLANAFEPSSRAAAAVGPNARRPRASSASTRPATSGASGPTTTRSTPSRSTAADEPVDVVGGDVEQARVRGDARRCRARTAARSLSASARARARSRARARPPPTTRTFKRSSSRASSRRFERAQSDAMKSSTRIAASVS